MTFVLTAENRGSEPAFQVTLTDAPPAQLTGCAVDSVTDGTGAGLATTGDLTAGLVLTAPLAENDGNPAGGGAPFGADTALVTVTCTVDPAVPPGTSLTNTAEVTWTSTATSASFFPSVSDDASVTVARPTMAKVITDVEPGYQAASPFGNNEPVHIGELVEYTVTVEVPEGVSTGATLFDQLDQGLAFVAVDSIVADAGVTTDVAGGFAAVRTGATISAAGTGAVNQDRRLTLDFGTLTSAADNDPSNNTVTVVYRAVVLNAANNNRGDRRNNRADWRYDDPGGGQAQVRVGAPNVRIREATLALDKQITPSFGDAGDTLRVTLTLAHDNGPSNADAFDVDLDDALGPGFLFAGGLAVDPGCTAAPTTGPGQAAGVVSASWTRFDDGETCSISFDVTLDAGVSSGSVLENCAEVTWESLRAADQPLDAAPTNTLSAERTGDPADPGGGANTYRVEDCAEAMVADVAITKTVMSTSEAHTADGEGRPAAPDLTIGEEVTFELIVVLPEGSTPQLVVTDFLPFAPGTLAATAARVANVGTQITLPGVPTVTLSDNQLGDSLDDTVVVDFGGPITNAADGDLDEGDRIRIEVDAVVVDVVGNAGGDEITNSSLVQFGPGLDGGDALDLDLVEPALLLTKSADLGAGDAGDTVTFTLRIEHAPASTADAFDVALADPLPPELTFAGFVGSGLGTCGDTPDTGPTEAGGVITATWSGFPRGAVCEVVFQAVLGVSVMPGQTVTNVASLDWNSLDTTTSAEERSYRLEDDWPILITDPGLTKTLVDTDVPETEADQKGPAEDLTVGEQVTFRAVASFIDGTTTGAQLSDQLPNADVVLRVVSSRIVRIGADLTVPGAAPGDPGDDCLPGCDGDGDGERDRAVWDLGDVVNAPDSDPDPDTDDEIEIEVVAVVVDSVNNEGTPGVDIDQRNTATLVAGGVSLSATAPFDIVAPELAVDKRIACRDDNANNACDPGEPAGEPLLVDAGDRVIYEVEIAHTPSSTAAAFGLVLDDLLPMAPGTAFVPGSVTAVLGIAPDTVNVGAGTLGFEWTDPIAVGVRYVVRYAVTLGAGAVAGVSYPNEATLGWRSLEDAGAPEVRGGSATDGASVTVFAPTILKQAVADSLPRTGSAAGDPLDLDATLGEQITYRLTVVFSEGSTPNAVVTDTTQNNAAGLLRVVGASVVGLGNNISTTLPGTPVITAPDTVTFDFGTVTNAPDGAENADDTITLEVTAQVVNDDDPAPPALNVDGEVLTNTATLTFGAGTTAQSAATIDVVEPGLALTKTLGPLVDGRLRVSVVATNGGTAPGFDLEVVDVLDETVFVAASAQAEGLPSGFELVQSSDGTNTTVTIRVAGDPTMPTEEAILDPMESVTLAFSVELQGGGMPPVTTNDNTASATLTSLPGADPEERIYSASAMDQGLAPSLMVTKSASPASTVAGGAVSFTIDIENMGDAQATRPVVFDTVPMFTTAGANPGWFVAPPPSTTPCAGRPAGTLCFLELAAPLAPSGTASVTFDVVVDAPLPAGVTQITNLAQVDTDELPPKDSNEPVVPVAAQPDLVITKDDGGVTAVPGGTVTYTLTYDNVGTQTATNATLLETVPARTVSATNPGWEVGAVGSGTPCDAQPAGTFCVFSIGTLPVGGGGSATFAVTLGDPKPAGPSEITNVASIADDGANGPDPTPDNNVDTEPTPVAAAPDLAVTKTDGGVGSVPGGTVTYALAYANNGDQGATGVVLTETVPTHTTSGTNLGWEVGTVGSGVPCDAQPAGTVCVLAVGALAASATGSATFTVTVDDPLPAGITQVLNTVTIGDDGANGPDPTPGDNTASDPTPVTAVPDLFVTKDDGGVTAVPGGTVTYTLTYGNVGDQNATGAVLTETVPANTTSATNAGWEVAPVGSGTPCDAQPAGTVCVLTVGAVPVGGGGSASFAVTVDNPLAAGVDQVENTVSIADDGANGPDPNPGNNGDTEPTPVDAAPDLAITKDDGGATATPGDTIPYTLAYENLGPQDATGVVLTETVPADTTSAANPGWEVAPVGSGTPCDAQPAATTCVFAVGNLAAGASGSATFAVVVDDPLAAGVTEIDNAVTIGDDGANGPDPDPGNNDDDDQTPVDAVPDLAIVKDDGGVTAAPGDTVTYTLAYSNVGDQGATGVVLTDTVPVHTVSATNPGWEVATVGSGTPCDVQPAGTVCVLAVGAVAAGDGGSATFAVTVDNPLPDGVEEVTNTASVADDGANGPDPNPDNNSDPDTTPVDAAPDLTVTKDDGGAIATPGATLTYAIAYANVGDQDATGVVLTETVPVATTSGANPGWEVAPVGSGVPCDLQPAGTTCLLAVGPLAAGASGSATFVVTVDAPKPAGVEEILNTVSIADDGANGADPTPENNQDTETTPADAGPDLAVTKDDGGVTVMPGDPITYTLDYANVGDQDATGVFLTETVPADTASGTNPGWEVATLGSGVPCDAQPAGTSCVLLIGDLDAGDSGQATFVVVVDDPLAAGVTSVTNTVVIGDDGASGPDQDPDNNAGTDPTDIEGTPDLDVLKTAEPPDGDGYRPGDVFEWTVTLINTGDQDLANLELEDVLPPEVLFVPESMVLDGVPLTDAPGDDDGEWDGDVTLTARIALLSVGTPVTFRFLTEVSGEDPENDGLVFNQAIVTDSEGGTTPSDDPGTTDTDDPTQVPLVLDTIVEIPTADGWGLGLLALLLGLAATRRLSPRRGGSLRRRAPGA
ncbi:MAG: isopeptide-forming domain-containing fimbrial protein [Acidobacteriota bacterium]